MNIGLIDVDGHNFPNFALMRLSAWHKAHGDNVEWCGDMYWDFDRVYKSKIFTFSPDIDLLALSSVRLLHSILFAWLHPALSILPRTRQRGWYTSRGTR